MILLHRLRTQNFKQLTDLNLCLPERGTVLIEGLNEAGKSSLFEAVFFALYGQTLGRDHDYGVRNLKTYNSQEMHVELDFSIDGRPFTISRRLVSNQKATLTCPTLNGQTEIFTGVRPIKQRLREELRLTPEALLNTCFVEQKGLERLESLQADQRRETVNELLNLGILSQLDEHYRITRDDHLALGTQRRRVEIAGLDAALPGLQVAELAAARCLVYNRILECEHHIEHLETEIKHAGARQTVISKRRSEIRTDLLRVEQLKARLKAIDADLGLRTRAWEQALRLLAAADEAVRRLETLEASLPVRETQLVAWEELCRRLAELERLETTAARQRDSVLQGKERLVRFDALQCQWDTGEVERQSLQAALRARETELTQAEKCLRERIRRNQRCERLALLLRHTAACEAVSNESASLAGQLETARGIAARLEEHRLRFKELEGHEERLRTRDEDLRELSRASSDLSAAERELESLRERQARIEALEAKRSRLDASGTAIEAGERLAEVELQKAEARIALTDWAAAANRCAESDPATGRLAELDLRQKEAVIRLHACGDALCQTTRTLRVAGGTAAAGLLVGIVGAAIQQIVVLGLVGGVLLLAGLVWMLVVGRRVASVRSDQAASQKTCDGLEGERRAVERDAQAAAAEHERRLVQEVECRRVLHQLAVEIPHSPADAHGTIASLPDTPVAAARQALEAARQQAVVWRNERELAQRSLDAERAGCPLGAAADPAVIERRIVDLSGKRDRLQRAVQQANELPKALEELGCEDVAGLKALLDATRARVSESTTADRSIPELETQCEVKALLAASELQAARTLAEEAELPGEAPGAWSAAAQSERTEHLQAVAALPDTALQSSVDEVRLVSASLKQQLTRLEAAQEQRRGELDRQPRATLAEDLRANEAAVAASKVALAPLSETWASLQAVSLPTHSGDLRPRLAVLRDELKRDQEQAAQLPGVRAERERHATDAEARDQELGTAWQTILGEAAPASPAAAVARLQEVRAGVQRELAAFDEAVLHREEEHLQKESGAPLRQQATCTHDRDQRRIREEGLLTELGVEPSTAIDSLPSRFPELGDAGERDSNGWGEELERRKEAVRANRADRRAKADTAVLGEAPLDISAEREALAQSERDLAVKRRAAEMVTQTRQSIVNRVMPLTMQNMRQILPLLTEGRYQDAEWDEQNNVISVYDMRAGSFQRKRVFSGGARDQISLALRLAFALATLPGEHNVRPGWLFLDEPLSSFDHARTQALVDLLTRGLVRKQFGQIFLISHSQSFDPGRFDYRIRMDGGQVIESNLPALSAAA